MKSAKAVQLATIFLTACLLPMLGCQKADPAKIFEYTNKNDSGGLQNELRKGIDAAGIERISKSYELTPLHIAANAQHVRVWHDWPHADMGAETRELAKRALTRRKRRHAATIGTRFAPRSRE